MRGVISIRQVLMIQTMSEKSSALRATPERCQQCWFSIMRLKHRQDFPQHSFSFLKNTAANLKLCENLLTSTQQANLSLCLLIFTRQLQDWQLSLFNLLQFLPSKTTSYLLAPIHIVLFYVKTLKTAGDLSGHLALF